MAKSTYRVGPSRIGLAFVCLLTALLSLPVLDAAPRGASFGRSSMAGSGTASMQLETVPARVSRVAVRPGTKGAEAWALGTSTARVPGYAQSSIGQVVFLKYSRATGWVPTGPPRNASGRIFNPVLGSFAIDATGQGWAVGDGGVILHKQASSDAWVESPQSRTITPQTLTSVSLAPNGDGYAAGVGPTILRLSGGVWTLDQPSPDMTAQITELQSIAAVSSNEAWAVATGQVTGVDSTSLLIYRRTSTGWTTVKTGQAIFDNPPATASQGPINRSAEAGVVAADSRGAWIGGRIHPRSATFPDGDPAPGDPSRAFVIRFDNRTGAFTSYCADIYSENNAAADVTRMCDEPFPTAPFHIASISIVPGGDVFAGGLGLFRFSGDGWYREPDAAGYLISISMGSNAEGFVASPGRSLGAGGLIRSSSTTIGHWTSSPRRSAIARWAQPQNEILQGIALARDGSGRAIAVGSGGAASLFSGTAWDQIEPGIGYGLHGVAWPEGDTPWAVGQFGTILHLSGNRWDYVDGPTRQSLYSVAFRTRSEGVAVGLGGTIITYRNGVWRDDSPASISNDLYEVIVTPDGYLAVGKDGAIVEGEPGRWRLRKEARSLVLRPGASAAPAFYSAGMLGDRIVVGGQDSALVVREPNGTIRTFEAPLQGTVLSLAGDDGALYASLSPNDQKFRGDIPVAQRGTVMRYANGRWTDIGLKRRVTLLRDKVDPSTFDDPILDLEMRSANEGWGVGGSPADLKDPTEGHFRSLPTSAVYHLTYGGDPTQPASVAPLDPPSSGVPFAAFGESWCGTGLCSAATGTGTMADEVALRIREEINSASAQPGGPKFVLFTGNMRRTGIPEELEQFRNYLKGFSIPVFAAPGSLDRFTGIDASQTTGQATGSGPGSGSNDYWKRVFASQPTPWGHGPKIAGFEPVGLTTSSDALEMAHNHYAFDYTENGRKVMRVVFIDSSTRSFGALTEQNPQEDQGRWMQTVLTEASDVLRIPAVVVMNQPTVLPSDQQIPNWTNNQADFESTVILARVSAVITGGPRMNAVDTIKGLVPMYVVGGGGAPLGREFVAGGESALEPASKLPTDGYYHAWHLMRLDPNDRPVPLFAQARVHTQAFPIIESLAMHSRSGYQIPAGNTTFITALTRGLPGGFSDPDQAKATYMLHGRSSLPCGYKGQGNGLCISGAAKLPRFRFYTEDPKIATFVQRDPLSPNKPYRIGKQIFLDPDGAEGLLCVFKLGRVGINAVAGLHRARIEIEGVPGNGPCIDAEVKGVRVVKPTPPEPENPPQPEDRRVFRNPRLRQEIAAIFPPPPAPVVAPAPPGAPGVGRKEEHEVEYETESHDDGHAFTALARQRREERLLSSETAWPMLGATVLMALFAAAVAGAMRERRAPQALRAQARWRR